MERLLVPGSQECGGSRTETCTATPLPWRGQDAYLRGTCQVLSKGGTREGEDLQNPESLAAQRLGATAIPPARACWPAGHCTTHCLHPEQRTSQVLPSHRFLSASQEHSEEQNQQKEKGEMRGLLLEGTRVI